MAELAFINPGVMDAESFAFAWRACAIQWREHIVPAWRGFLPVPATERYPVSGFTDSSQLVPGSHWPLQIVKSTGDPGVLGDHTGLRALWRAFGRSIPDSVTMSHELEMGVDPFLDAWAPMPGTDDMEAVEICDRVQFDSYPITVDIGGQKRDVMVSNFLYPAAFGYESEDGHGRLDHMNLLTSPADNRGYRIVRRADGRIENHFARSLTVEQCDGIAFKSTRDPMSRTARRFA